MALNPEKTARVAVLLEASHLEMLDAVQRPTESMTATFRRLLVEEYRRQQRGGLAAGDAPDAA